VEDERKPPSREVLSIPYVVGRYLVHIFGYSGELNLLLPEEEVAAILAGPRTTSGTPNTTSATDLYMQKLQQADVELVALLPPEWRPLGDVAGLKPGQLLGLGARAGGPVEIRAAGQMLYHAHMVPGGNGIRLEIVDREGSL
jgi:flagellar motor switch protein FliM